MMAETRYINTDLDLVSADDLTPLVEALTAAGLTSLGLVRGESGAWQVSMEAGADHTQPEATILDLVAALEALNGLASDLLASSTLKEFNIGFDGGDAPWEFTAVVSPALLKRMAALKAGIRITIYPPVRSPLLA